MKNPIMKVTVDVKNAQATEKTRGSDMVAEGMMEVHTAHATSTPVVETSKALKFIFTQGPSFTTVK